MSATDNAGQATETLQATGSMTSLTANDLQKSVNFYTEGLGFEITDQNEHEGVVRFVAMKAGSVNLGIGQDDFAKGRDRVKGVGMRLWINTSKDIHALADRVKAAGVKLDSGPEPLPWGPMAISMTDPDGFLITISADS